MGQHPIAAASVFWRPLLRDKFAILASAKYRDVSWSKSTDDGCLLHAEQDGATVHVAEAKGGGYSWRAGDANGSAKTLVDAKLDAVDAAKGVKAGARYTIDPDLAMPDAAKISTRDASQLSDDGLKREADALKSIGKRRGLRDNEERDLQAIKNEAKKRGVRLSEMDASRAYNAFGLSPMALECLAAAVKAGGTYKPPAAKDGSPKALAIEELVTASAVKRNPDGSLSVVDGAERWLTQDASLKASAAKYSSISEIQDAIRKGRAFLDDETSGSGYVRVVSYDPNTHEAKLANGKSKRVMPDSFSIQGYSEAHAFSASDPAAVCADIHYHGTDAQRAAFGEAGDRATDPPGSWLAKCVEKIGAHGSAGKPALAYSAALFAAVDADASLKACEKVCLLYAVQGSLERNEVTFDVIDGLLARGLVEPTGDRKTYRASESAARKYGANWQKGFEGSERAQIGDFQARVFESQGEWHWKLDKPPALVGQGVESTKDAAKRASESAARQLGAKFAAGAVEWKCVDPRQTTQVTSTERTILVRVNQDGRGVPTPEDEVTFRSLAQKGLVEMDESGAYHITPAGTDALAGGGVKSAVSDRKVDATVEKFGANWQKSGASNLQATIDIPAGGGKPPGGMSLVVKKQSDGSFGWVTYYNGKTVSTGSESTVEAAKAKAEAAAKSQGAKFSSSSQSSDKPLHATAPRIPTGEYLAIYDEATNTYTVKDVPIFAEHQVPGAKFKIGEKWMLAAVQKAKDRATADKYVAPLHIRHHGDGEGTTRAGFVMPTEVKHSMYEGRETFVLYADLVGIPPEVYADIKARKLPYRSVEINKVDVPEISSLALLEDEVPYFRLPMLGIGEEAGGAPKSIAASARRIRQSASMTPCVAYAESATLGRATYLYSEAGMAKLAAGGKAMKYGANWIVKRQSPRYIVADIGGYELQSALVGGAWEWGVLDKKQDKYVKQGGHSSEEGSKSAAEQAARSMGAKFNQSSSSGATQMKKFADKTEDEKEQAVSAKMRALRMEAGNEDDDEETLRAKAFAALRLAEGDQPNLDDEDPTKLADTLQGDTPLTEGATAKPGSPGGQPGASEALARQFGAMTKVLGSIAAGQKRMIGMMAKAYDMSVDDDEEPVKAAAGDVPGEDDDEGPVEMKASAKMAARLTTVEGKLARAESSAKIDRAVKYALRELDGYSVGDPEDVEKRIRAGAMKYGEGWIKEYLSDVKKLAPKAPTDGDEPGIGDENVGDLPEFVLKYRAGGPEKLEHVIGLHRTWMDLKSRGQGTFAKDDTSEKFIKASMHYSAVDGNGVVK